ncbi:hypothetical protein VR7878_02489 [Vibrio ruber DSM 16370]|uniref:Uncharacterized protein n=1 Tax=Vibrio ruber (strain DSM 16370 / JCM 11486 / BCRC 17186 / CECT 7878 / LMG 23124 / VR1) TaxID=1123498 RepID=A0A1R4LMH3_VIBR1|nr:hypothetical protein VR7878_02489 [Vibrio ruber DSM 16370]
MQVFHLNLCSGFAFEQTFSVIYVHLIIVPDSAQTFSVRLTRNLPTCLIYMNGNYFHGISYRFEFITSDNHQYAYLFLLCLKK